MGALAVAIVFSSSIALVFKWANKYQTNALAVSFVNYVVATTISGVSLANSSLVMDWQGNLQRVVILGVMTGVFFLGAFMAYQYAVRQEGAALSGMYMKIGILLPMIIAMVVWSEIPTQVQLIGIVLLLCGIVLSNYEKGMKMVWHKALIVLFFMGGMAEFMNKWFQQTSDLTYKPLFLTMTFGTALVLSGLLLVIQKIKPTKNDIKTGVLVGIPNMLTSFFLIAALASLDTSVVFASYSAGAIALITVLSALMFKETIKKKNSLALVVTMFGLVLVNL